MGDLFDGYGPSGDGPLRHAFDEVVATSTGTRPQYRDVAWWGLDPTNGGDIGLRHVVAARGRDHADVAPVRGIYAGSATHETSVTVTITRTV